MRVYLHGVRSFGQPGAFFMQIRMQNGKKGHATKIAVKTLSVTINHAIT
jgi:hypothetical protein